MTTTRDVGHFTFTPIGNTTHVTIRGELITGNRQAFKQHVLDELARGQRHFLIDCAHCGYIDSAGLGVLVSLSKRIREAKGELEILNLNDDLMTLFELTNLTTLFRIRRA